jgi:aminocarboxymuconate-semialdehyde decarboxylase
MIVDAHCHVVVKQMTAPAVPADWRPVTGRVDGRYTLSFRGTEITSVVGEFTDIATMLGQAAAAGIGHLLLSPWITLVPAGGGYSRAELGQVRQVCDVQNSALAEAVRGHPGRVSAVGAVALHDPALAIAQLLELMAAGLSGVELPASVAGRYLGDDLFLPFWEAAEAAGALVFVHPTTRGFELPVLARYYLWNSVGNPVETAVTAAHMTMAGVLDRHPGLRVLLAHGGGALPVVRGRLRRACAVRPEAGARLPAGPDPSLRRFYYDTVTHDRDLLAGLVGYAGATQVLLGSDRPFDMGSDDPVGEVAALALGEAEDLVLGGNAARLLGIGDGLPGH